MVRRPLLALALLPVAALATAATPVALRGVAPGLWEVGRSATGSDARRLCLRDVALISQWESQGGQCSRAVVADAPRRMTVQYSCASGDFGRSEIDVITPRTLRIATQGIARGAPFNYVLHARRVDDCRR